MWDHSTSPLHGLAGVTFRSWGKSLRSISTSPYRYAIHTYIIPHLRPYLQVLREVLEELQHIPVHDPPVTALK